ncbi:unnamed protein product [marine sediment metagenome]|uniref:Uncharacterized protein n=1 Tax=marine sediment metagenome TaxID=412755 RepID=X1UPT1_9ZZZZ
METDEKQTHWLTEEEVITLLRSENYNPGEQAEAIKGLLGLRRKGIIEELGILCVEPDQPITSETIKNIKVEYIVIKPSKALMEFIREGKKNEN